MTWADMFIFELLRGGQNVGSCTNVGLDGVVGTALGMLSTARDTRMATREGIVSQSGSGLHAGRDGGLEGLAIWKRDLKGLMSLVVFLFRVGLDA